jgi:hypothetical protein
MRGIVTSRTRSWGAGGQSGPGGSRNQANCGTFRDVARHRAASEHASAHSLQTAGIGLLESSTCAEHCPHETLLPGGCSTRFGTAATRGGEAIVPE